MAGPSRAAEEFPEFEAGRELVELFLVWKTSTGNLERRFQSLAEVDTPQGPSERTSDRPFQRRWAADKLPVATTGVA